MAEFRAVVAVVMAAILFAGCLGGGPATDAADNGGGRPSGSVDVTQDTAPAGRADGQTGAIEGQVFNENGAPLRSAFVVLIGTQNSSGVDKLGRFAFSHIKPAAYRLRVDAQDYHGHENDIRVDAGKVTRVNVTLAALVDRGAGFREHLHDFFGDEPKKVLVDDSFNFPPTQAFGGSGTGVYCIGNGSGGCLASSGAQTTAGLPPPLKIPLPDGVIVYPGTVELEVTIDWASQQYAPEVDFRYLAANSNAPIPPVKFKPKETKTFKVDAITNDHGHQVFSLWTFEVFAWANVGPYRFHHQDFVRMYVGPFHVKIVAVKGVIPPEAPHRDFWANGDTLLVMPSKQTRVTVIPTATRNPKQTTACSATSWCFTLSDGQFVPPGTTRLDITLDYAASTAAVTPYMTPKTLSIRTAAVNPQYATWDDYRTDRPAKQSTGHAEWSLKLEPKETDAFYQKKSLWIFWLANEGKEKDDRFMDECYTGCGGTTYTLTVTAINENWEPPPATAP